MKNIILCLTIPFFSAHALTTQELFVKINESNLMLKEEQQSLKAIESSSSTVWQSPELAISEMNGNTPFFDSEMKMQRSIEISQMLPNPLMLSANNKIKKNSVQVQTEQVGLIYKTLKSEAFITFIGIYQNKKEFEIYSSKKILLENFLHHLKAAQVQGQEEKIQISEVRSDLDELNLNLTLNKNEYQRMKKMLNQMLNVAPDSEISDPVLDHIELNKNIDLQRNTELNIINSKINLMESDLSMKYSQFFPEVSLKAKFNKGYMPTVPDSKEFMIGITLPFIFWGQRTSGMDTAQFKIEAMKFARDNKLTANRSRADILQSEIDDLILNLNFLKDTSLPIKEKKMKLFLNYSYTDMKTLMNYKMSFDDLYMLKMKILEKEMELQKKYFEWTQLEG